MSGKPRTRLPINQVLSSNIVGLNDHRVLIAAAIVTGLNDRVGEMLDLGGQVDVLFEFAIQVQTNEPEGADGVTEKK